MDNKKKKMIVQAKPVQIKPISKSFAKPVEFKKVELKPVKVGIMQKKAKR
jgi:hypothetical protein